MIKLIITTLSPLLLITSCIKTNQIKPDQTLIIPGKQCRGIKIGDTSSLKSIKTKTRQSLFKNILRINAGFDIEFDSYSKTLDYVVLFDNNITKAVILNHIKNDVTSDAVKISRGAENFILFYGNRDLTTVNSERNIIYLYRKRGIAICDDTTDDTVDLLIIFQP